MIASVNVTVIATVGLRLLHAALHEVQLTHKPMFTGILARRTKAQNLIRPIAVSSQRTNPYLTLTLVQLLEKCCINLWAIVELSTHPNALSLFHALLI